MLKFLPFNNQPTLASGALVTSSYINGAKNNVESYLNSIDTITDSIKTTNTNLGATDYINPVDASSAGAGGLFMNLPRISTLSGLLGGFYFKKLDSTFNPIYLTPFNEGIESLRLPATSPIDAVTTLEVPDQSVLIYPVNNKWRIFQHYLPISSIGCRVYLTNTQNIATAGQYVKVNLDTKEYDLRSLFDITQSQFTAPVTGLYQVSGSLSTASSSGVRNYLLGMYINGNFSRLLFQLNDILNERYVSLSFCTVIKLTKGSLLSLYVACNQVHTVRPNSELSYLEIQLLSL